MYRPEIGLPCRFIGWFFADGAERQVSLLCRADSYNPLSLSRPPPFRGNAGTCRAALAEPGCLRIVASLLPAARRLMAPSSRSPLLHRCARRALLILSAPRRSEPAYEPWSNWEQILRCAQDGGVGVPGVPESGTRGAFYPLFSFRRPLFWDARHTGTAEKIIGSVQVCKPGRICLRESSKTVCVCR